MALPIVATISSIISSLIYRLLVAAITAFTELFA
jgi:hypothetical protein